MTRLDIDVPAPAESEGPRAVHFAELRSFMAKASKTAMELAAIITPQIEARRLDTAQALIAVLLYAAHFARKAGGTAKDFMDSAEQAFADAEELFATDVVDVLRAARKLITTGVTGWCQGEMALKWVKDSTLPEGKKLVGCHVDDKYASRWSLLGAIEHSADAKSNRERARAAVVLAIRDSGWQFKPGSLDVTVINEYNDHGWVPPLPKLVLPERPEASAPAEALANYEDTVKRMKHDYETITVPQWPKPAVPGRTREEVLVVIDRAIAILGS
jgi:hypothetical protein